jgi:hypothetical protein
MLRGFVRWHSQRQIFADDYFVFFGLLTLTGLTVVITLVLPQFYLAGVYTAAMMRDPTTPMPLPPDEFVQRTQTSLKLMFSQMLLFWTTLWAGTYIRNYISSPYLLMLDSQVLHPVLLSPSPEWAASIYQSLVGLLHVGHAIVPCVHAIKFPNLSAIVEVLER